MAGSASWVPNDSIAETDHPPETTARNAGVAGQQQRRIRTEANRAMEAPATQQTISTEEFVFNQLWGYTAPPLTQNQITAITDMHENLRLLVRCILRGVPPGPIRVAALMQLSQIRALLIDSITTNGMSL